MKTQLVRTLMLVLCVILICCSDSEVSDSRAEDKDDNQPEAQQEQHEPAEPVVSKSEARRDVSTRAERLSGVWRGDGPTTKGMEVAISQTGLVATKDSKRGLRQYEWHDITDEVRKQSDKEADMWLAVTGGKYGVELWSIYFSEDSMSAHILVERRKAPPGHKLEAMKLRYVKGLYDSD